MRFIIREQDYEKLVAAGKFRLEMNGLPTGATESWRITRLNEGYGWLRVDVDRRKTSENSSTLYHLAFSSVWRPERLKFRHFVDSFEIVGDLQFDEETISLYRDMNGQRIESEEKIPAGYRFYLPAIIGWALLPATADDGECWIFSLDRNREFNLTRHQVEIRREERGVVAVTGQDVAAQRYSIDWGTEIQYLWLDDFGLPVLSEREDGFRAVETQYIRYERSPNHQEP